MYMYVCIDAHHVRVPSLSLCAVCRHSDVPALVGGDDLHLLPGLLCDVAARGPATRRALVPQEPQRPELPPRARGNSFLTRFKSG